MHRGGNDSSLEDRVPELKESINSEASRKCASKNKPITRKVVHQRLKEQHVEQLWYINLAITNEIKCCTRQFRTMPSRFRHYKPGKAYGGQADLPSSTFGDLKVTKCNTGRKSNRRKCVVGSNVSHE